MPSVDESAKAFLTLSNKGELTMNEEFDYVSPEEEAFLQVLRELYEQLPKNTMWIVHPQNYPRILRSVSRILQVIRKDSPEATHTIGFDELLGTSLCLTVESRTFDFSSCNTSLN